MKYVGRRIEVDKWYMPLEHQLDCKLPSKPCRLPVWEFVGFVKKLKEVETPENDLLIEHKTL